MKIFIYVLLGILFHFEGFDSIQAEKFNGPTEVRENEPWEIECTDLPLRKRVVWTRNEEPIEELATGEIQVILHQNNSSVLKTDHARISDEGTYKCFSNSSESFYLKVIPIVKFKVLTNDDIPLNLECKNLAPGAKVIWKKTGVPVNEVFAKNPDLIKINDGILIILKNTDEVFGNYSCNIAGNEISTQYFQIVPKPIVSAWKKISAFKGDGLYLFCQGNFYPGLKVRWEFAGKTYKYGQKRVRLLKDEESNINGALLRVDDIDWNDAGNVTCKAAYDWNDSPNHMGSATGLLEVLKKP